AGLQRRGADRARPGRPPSPPGGPAGWPRAARYGPAAPTPPGGGARSRGGGAATRAAGAGPPGGRSSRPPGAPAAAPAPRAGEPRPASSRPPGAGPLPDAPEIVEGMARMQANSEFFLAHLRPATIGYVPDVAALRAASPRIVVGAGEAPAGQMPHQAALVLAE